MLTPETFHEQILPYLYDLLDAQERRDFEAYVEASPEARAMLEGARAKQALLTEAVREQFPEVRFTPPPAQPAKPTLKMESQRLTRRRDKEPRQVRLGWAVAAAILLVVLGGGTVLSIGGWMGHKNRVADASNRRERAAIAQVDLRQKQQEDLRRAQEDIRAIQEQINNLVDDWKKETNVQRKLFDKKQVQVIIQSPKSLQAGAPNAIKIEMKANPNLPPNHPPLADTVRTVDARVIDQASKKVLYEEKLKAERLPAMFALDLPRDLPVRPGADLLLEIVGKSALEAPIEIREHLAVAMPEYMTHLYTDRPMYRPGETVHFRSLTVERFSMKPPQEDLRLQFTLTGPRGKLDLPHATGAAVAADNTGAVLKGPDGQPLRGIGAGEFRLPDDLAGGQYVLQVGEANDRFPAERRAFIVHQWQAPRLNKEVTFDRSSYGPGDIVQGWTRAVRVEGGPGNQPQGQQITATITIAVDGQIVPVLQNIPLDADGRLSFRASAPLPVNMQQGNASISIAFNDGGNIETLVRPIPIVLGKLFVDFYPEGGDLVSGQPGRVYFQARTATGKPADLTGRVVDHTGKVVAKVRTLTDDKEPGVNQGMGAFTFTPQAGATYELKIDSPPGLHGKDGKTRYVLAGAKIGGVTLRLPQGVVEEFIDVEVTSAARDRELLIGAYCRGKLLDHVVVDAKSGKPAQATLRPTAQVGGVYRITVFEKQDAKFLPLAERLVYRPATTKLDLTVSPDKPVYYPGERVRLALKAETEKRELSPAVLLVSVVDLSVSKLADDKTVRAMPTHFLLTSEVRRPEDLESADFFLGSHPRAKEALDLLLGVQGWRRFAEQNPARFQNSPDAQRILMAASPKATQKTNPEKELFKKLDERFTGQYVDLQKKLGEVEKREGGNPDTQQQIQIQMANEQTARNQIDEAAMNLELYERFLIRLGLAVLVLTLLGVGLVSLYVGMRRLSRGRSAVAFFVVGTVVLVFLFMGSLAGTFFLMGGRGFDAFDRDMEFARVAEKKAVAAAMAPMPPPMAPGQGVDMAADMVPAPKMEQRAGMLENMPRDDRGDRIRLIAEDELRAEPMAAPVQNLAKNQVEMVANQPMGPMGAGGPMPPGMIMAGDFPPGGGPMGGVPLGPMGMGGKGMFGPNQFERLQRRLGNFDVLISQQLGRHIELPKPADPFVVREYAHKREFGPPGVRHDFTETLFWHPALVTKDGKINVGFELSDANTRFQVIALGHSLDGRLGATTFEFASRLPVSIDPKVPIEVTGSDTVVIPVAVANDKDEPASVNIEVMHKNLTFIGDQINTKAENVLLDVGARARKRALLSFTPAVKQGEASVRVSGDFGPLGRDMVERRFKIVPEGFPAVFAQSGLLEKTASHDFQLPDTWVPGTLRCQVQVYPSTLAELQKGLESLLREPCGCFEQSSSSNYPNVLILNYLKEADLSNPEIEKRARQLMTSGYSKLTSFECLDPRDSKRQGYEWFGQTAPPHEALTAYGLLQFKDMAKVHPVDEEMMLRTQKYLLGQRDGKGGFKRNPRSLDSFGRAPEHVTNAYIVWGLTESGTEADLSVELKALFDKAKDSSDPYFLALVGISHLNVNKTKEAVELFKKLVGLQRDDGHLEGATTSITGSGGRDLMIETTALATLGWLKANRPDEFALATDKAAKWLGQQRGGYGGFGSTQSTILALKALIAHTREHKKTPEPGSLQLFVNDNNNSAAIKSFGAGLQEPITLAVPEEDLFKPGLNRVRVQMTGNNQFPYTLSITYQTLKPVNPEGCPVHMSTYLNKTDAKEGESVRLTAKVENKSGKGQGMAVAVIGLPGGLALPEDFGQLKELSALRENGAKPGLISAWELRGRELVLYWRDLAPDAKLEVNLDLVCRLPGAYRGPAPRSYLYYDADKKFWSEPLAITIRAAEER